MSALFLISFHVALMVGSSSWFSHNSFNSCNVGNSFTSHCAYRNKQVFFHPTMGGVILRLGTLPEPRESENMFLGGCSSAAQPD